MTSFCSFTRAHPSHGGICKIAEIIAASTASRSNYRRGKARPPISGTTTSTFESPLYYPNTRADAKGRDQALRNTPDLQPPFSLLLDTSTSQFPLTASPLGFLCFFSPDLNAKEDEGSESQVSEYKSIPTRTSFCLRCTAFLTQVILIHSLG